MGAPIEGMVEESSSGNWSSASQTRPAPSSGKALRAPGRN
jgi:hypothetical protein